MEDINLGRGDGEGNIGERIFFFFFQVLSLSSLGKFDASQDLISKRGQRERR